MQNTHIFWEIASVNHDHFFAKEGYMKQVNVVEILKVCTRPIHVTFTVHTQARLEPIIPFP